MTTYTYRCTDPEGCDLCGGRQEIFHAMSAAPLAVCPNCPRTIERTVSLPQAPIVSGSKITDKKLNNSGMSKYQNLGDGRYEKVAGPPEAPKFIDKNKLP